jgi:DNA-binding response OmpR family regulator
MGFSMQRILVVDDDPGITNVLKRSLSYDGYSVDVAGSGEEALSIARASYPDAVILDILMPGLDGISVLRRLRAADEQLPILLLTAKDAPADQVLGLSSGADDYVVKPFTYDVLLARIRALLRRQEADRLPVLHFADLSLDSATRQGRRSEREIDLTATEYDLLREFLQHPRRVLPKDLLLERVWGYDFGGNVNVLEVYVKQLRQKLEACGEPRLIHTLRGAGYILREE